MHIVCTDTQFPKHCLGYFTFFGNSREYFGYVFEFVLVFVVCFVCVVFVCVFVYVCVCVLCICIIFVFLFIFHCISSSVSVSVLSCSCCPSLSCSMKSYIHSFASCASFCVCLSVFPFIGGLFSISLIS